MRDPNHGSAGEANGEEKKRTGSKHALLESFLSRPYLLSAPMRTHQQPYQDLERIIEFDFLRATEAAALNTLPWIGQR